MWLPSHSLFLPFVSNDFNSGRETFNYRIMSHTKVSVEGRNYTVSKSFDVEDVIFMLLAEAEISEAASMNPEDDDINRDSHRSAMYYMTGRAFELRQRCVSNKAI